LGTAAPRHKPFRHTRDLYLERLEQRDLFSVSPPKILSVTPADFTNTGATNPTITVNFSEAMDPIEASTASDYLLFNSSGQQISPLNVTYSQTVASPGNPATYFSTVTVPNQLPAGAYTLFLRGDLIDEATDTYALSTPGQLVVANMGESQATPPQPGPSTVSTINVATNGTLDTATSYPLGESQAVPPFPPPLLVTVADFNGDGVNDVAVVNTIGGANTLSIYDGLAPSPANPLGGFASTPTFTEPLPTGANPVDPVAILAFSETQFVVPGIHGPDIAITDFNNGQVDVFANTTTLNGPTSFGAGQAFATGTHPVGLVAASFDGTQKIDLATVDSVEDKQALFDLYILKGNARQVPNPPAAPPLFNAAAVIHVGGPGVPLGPVAIFPAFDNPSGLAVGQLVNTDNRPDLAFSGNDGVVTILNKSPTNSPGNFQFIGGFADISVTQPWQHIAMGQIDQGVTPANDFPVEDLVVSDDSTAELWVYVNGGSGVAFATHKYTYAGLSTPSAVISEIPSLLLADLGPSPGTVEVPTIPGAPGTGNLDLLFPYTNANGTVNGYLVFDNLHDPTGAATHSPGPYPDLAPGVYYQTDNAPVALTIGNGGDDNLGAITVIENGQFVAGRNGVGTNGGDMNGDGIPDVVTVNTGVIVNNLTGRSISVVRGKGDGTFLDASTTTEVNGGTSTNPIIPAPESIAVGDLNGDGIPDYVVADSGLNQVEVYMGIAPSGPGGAVTYKAPVIYSTSVTSSSGLSGVDPVSVTLADLTGTGVLDVVTADNADNKISILYNDGTGKFSAAHLISVGAGPTQVIAGVFDKYGGGATPTKKAEDLVIAHNGTGAGGVSVLINDNLGDRQFINTNVPTEYGSGDFVTAVASGDFNADGNLDFVFTNAPLSGPGSVILMEGDGHGNFTRVGAPISVAADPVALAVADVNRDGYDDVIVGSQSPNPNTAIGVLLNTVGDGFRPPVYTALPNDTPVNSIAVTDLPVTVDTTLKASIDAVQTSIPVLSVAGFPTVPGFKITIDSETMTVTAINAAANTFTVTRGASATIHAANAVVTASNVVNPYPSLVVGTFPVSLTAPLPVVDNVFTLQGVGDGTFVNALPYEAGGPPSPTTVAVASDPLIRLTTFFMGGTLVSNNLVENGTFDVRDLSNESGNLDGWQTFAVQDSNGRWETQAATTAGSFSPLSGAAVPRPDGLYQAMLDESNVTPLPFSSTTTNPNAPSSYQGSNFLYQDVTIPANVSAASFTIRLTIDNFASEYATGNPDSTLDYRQAPGVADQQVRVDLVNPNDPITATNADTPGSVYLNVFQSDQSTPLDTTTPLTITVPDVTSLAGKTVRIRIAVVNNLDQLVVGVDDVALDVTFNDNGGAAVAPTLAGLALRNPGFLAGTANTPTTTDPTLVGLVGSGGGIGNIASIAFSGFTPATPGAVYKTNYFDSQGNFAVTLPNITPGTYTVNVTVQDVAGNVTTNQIQFTYEGLSNTAWSAVGPGPVDVTSEANISYSSVTGEVTAVATDPNDPSGNTILVGSANGGIWRTTDGGNSWTPETDNLTYGGQPINTPISDITFSPSNPSVVYAATGVGDALPTSHGSVGILYSIDDGLPGTWQVLTSAGLPGISPPITNPSAANNSYNVFGPTSLFGAARITSLAVAGLRNGSTLPDPIYVGVASGGEFGPGVYRSLNGGETWDNIMPLSSLTIPTGDAAPATLASVTSLVVNPRDTSQLYVGLGNIGLVTNSTSAGVWTTPNADAPVVTSGGVTTGPTWNPLLGGDITALKNDNLPSDLKNTPATVTVGRVTVAEGFASPSTGPGASIATLYVLIGNPSALPATTPQATGGDVDYGNGVVGAGKAAGLYKSPDAGNDWTQVMLKSNTAAAGANPSFTNVNLLGNDANNVGQLVVDPTDVNVVYVGGADNAAASVGLIRVDTGDMRDVNWYLDTVANPTLAKSVTGVAAADPTNDGDDLAKLAAAQADGGTYPGGKGAYTGEGVSWYDLESNSFSPDFSSTKGMEPQPSVPAARTSGFKAFASTSLSRLPAEVDALTLDPSGRLLIGTQEGIWRAVYHGTGYDYSSGGTGIVALTNQTAVPPTAAITITTLNGNLQIAELTSVASDPQIRGQFYASSYDIGTLMTPGGLNWQTMGLNGPSPGTGVPIPNTSVDAGTVVVASPDPNAPVGQPTTIYRDFAYTQKGNGYFPEINQQNGALGSWVASLTPGISRQNNAGYFPVLVIDPNKVFNSGVEQNFLLFGTDRVYETPTSTFNWSVVGPNQPLSAAGGLITAAAIAPSSTNASGLPQVFYAGDNLGEVFVTTNAGTWTMVAASGALTGGVVAPVTGISVDPNNPSLAYITFGGTGSYSHVYRLTLSSSGATLTSISPSGTTSQDGLPPEVAAYSIVTDPIPSAGALGGHLFVGTDVGVFVSVNQGGSWARFAAGSIPNVPVVNLQFNQQLLQLTAATEGRGAFVMSVDYVGASVVSVTPSTPVGPGLTKVDVTFSKAISSFPLTQITITSPAGVPITPTSVTNVSVTPPGQSNPANVWEIDFPAQTADGVYTFRVGPNVLDYVLNPMDQNGNHIDGEAGDAYTFEVAINSTDDGQFISGLYNQLLGRAADTNGFINDLNLIDPARFAALPTVSATLVISTAARTQLINDLYSSTSSTASTVGIANLLGGAPTGATIQPAAALNLLQQGASIEQLIGLIASSDQFFDLPTVNETDAGFLTQLYTDLLGPGATPPAAVLTSLQNAETNSRLIQAGTFVNSNTYIDALVSAEYNALLGPFAPAILPLSTWENAFHNGTATYYSLIASLMETGSPGSPTTPGFYQNAPNIITPLGLPTPLASDTVFIQAVYQELFNGTPGVPTASNAEVNYWLGQFSQGVTHQQMINSEIYSDRYRQALITSLYEQYLGRSPSATELTTWDGVLTNGGSPQYLIASITSSPEFYADSAGADTKLHTTDADWVINLYSKAQVLGGPTNSQLSATTGALDRAEIGARGGIVAGLTSGSAYRTQLINFVYNNFLHRNANATEMAMWQAFLAGPPNGPGTISRDEWLISSVLATKEYFYDQTDANGLHTNVQWVNSLFPSLRIPVNATLATNDVNQILNAYATQRTQVSLTIQFSTEYRTDVINAGFEKFLGRAPTAAELSSWLSSFAQGATQEFFYASLMGLTEFFNHSPAVLGGGGTATATTFVKAVFKLVLPWYNASSVLNYWVGQIQSGAMTQFQFAATLIAGPLYLFTIDDSTDGAVNAIYNKLLGVNATTTQIAGYQSNYPGFSFDIDDTVIANLAATSAYFLDQPPVPKHIFP
jgi:hypothetical protein